MATEIALIGHLESVDAYGQLLGGTRDAGGRGPALDPAHVAAVVPRSEPIAGGAIRVRSPRGGELDAVYIDLGFLPAWTRSSDTLEKLRSACDDAERSGARLATLGGFASILAERHGYDPSSAGGLPFTTGNTLTAAVIAAQVESLAPEMRVTVVGAGDLGTGVARILSWRGHRLTLVSRSRSPLEAIASELGAEIGQWPDAAARADVVVLVASASGLSLDDVGARTVVLDAGHPPNARPAGRYLPAGRVRYARPPECERPELYDLLFPGEGSLAWLAEGLVLGLEHRFEPFSQGRGRIRPERAAEILALAERHGVVPARLAL